MKKKTIIQMIIIIVLLIAILLIAIYLNKDNNSTFTNMHRNNIKKTDRINMYVFYGLTCPHCEDLYKMLKENKNYEKYYDLYSFGVWYDKENQKFMDDVSKKLDKNISGVPYIIIGDKTFSGYSKTNSKTILNTIKEQYKNKNYKDIIYNIK